MPPKIDAETNKTHCCTRIPCPSLIRIRFPDQAIASCPMTGAEEGSRRTTRRDRADLDHALTQPCVTARPLFRSNAWCASSLHPTESPPRRNQPSAIGRDEVCEGGRSEIGHRAAGGFEGFRHRW